MEAERIFDEEEFLEMAGSAGSFVAGEFSGLSP